MCGIAGIVDFRNEENKHGVPELLVMMADKLKHRGPDDEGYLLVYPDGTQPAYGKDTNPDIKRQIGIVDINHARNGGMMGFAHRRLSIIDKSFAGHQPMQSRDGRFTMVYNGEIYNYKDLRQQLIKYGYTFQSDTDTEVLLAAYQHWGDFMTKYLEGMWAFVIWDKDKNMLFGSRDRFGVKPLYVHKGAGYFGFASEIKALVELPIMEKKVFRPAAFEYLVNGKLEYDLPSMFVDIQEVLPSTSFQFLLEERAYKSWNHYYLGYKPDLGKFDDDKFKHASHKIRKSITQSIKDRLIGEAPVGVCLSGGVDSSTITCVLDKIMRETPNENVGKRIKAFTVSYQDRKLDETRYAERVVNQVNADWTKITPTSEQFMAGLEDMAYTQDLPILGTGTFSHYLLMQKVAESGVKVVLDGIGGDELFSGYSHHFNVYMHDLWENGRYGAYLQNFLTANSSFASRGGLIRSRMWYLYFQMAEKYRKSLISQNTHWENTYLRSEFWGRYKKKFEITTMKNLNATMHEEFTGHKMKYMLRNADRNAMRFGVENRVPFVDNHSLVEYMFNTPIAYKVRYGQSKILLRSAMGTTLPREILFRRDKKGFIGPDAKWLVANKSELLSYISPEVKDLFDVKALNKDWNRIVSRANSDGTERLWRMIFFAVWRKVYNV